MCRYERGRRGHLDRNGIEVHLGRRALAQSLVWSLIVVEVQVLAQALSGLSWTVVVVQIDLVILYSAPQPLGEDVVDSAPSTIDADLHARQEQPLLVVGAGEVAAPSAGSGQALVAVTDERPRLGERLIQVVQDETQLQRLVKLPTGKLST